jgi:hypothetical protein
VGYTTDLRVRGAEDGPYDLNLMLTQSARMLRLDCDDTPWYVGLELDRVLREMKLAGIWAASQGDQTPSS